MARGEGEGRASTRHDGEWRRRRREEESGAGASSLRESPVVPGELKKQDSFEGHEAAVSLLNEVVRW